MLEELVELLELFEWATNEFQSNKVSSSRIYPTIKSIQSKLSRSADKTWYHTVELRENILKSVNNRFNDQIDQECFKLATYLDPLMGPEMFEPYERKNVVNLLKQKIALANPELAATSNKNVNCNEKVRNVSKNFIRYETETTDKPMALDVIEEIIENTII